ncbi:MAG: hypothetical protein LW768_10805 [Rubrivivax sp.]|jgi:hypothetical protein|nr:hypothetical protein [Rubrivivax sp.]
MQPETGASHGGVPLDPRPFDETFAGALLGLLGVADARQVAEFTLKVDAPNRVHLVVKRIVGRPDPLGCVEQLQTESFSITGDAGPETFAFRILRSLKCSGIESVMGFELRVVGQEVAYLTVKQVLVRNAGQQALLELLRGERLLVTAEPINRDFEA